MTFSGALMAIFFVSMLTASIFLDTVKKDQRKREKGILKALKFMKTTDKTRMKTMINAAEARRIKNGKNVDNNLVVILEDLDEKIKIMARAGESSLSITIHGTVDPRRITSCFVLDQMDNYLINELRLLGYKIEFCGIEERFFNDSSCKSENSRVINTIIHW